MACVFREAYTNCGYSPFLSFEVIDLQSRVQSLLELGAVLDGPIKYAEQGKVTHHPSCSHTQRCQITSMCMTVPVCADCSPERPRRADAQPL